MNNAMTRFLLNFLRTSRQSILSLLDGLHTQTPAFLVWRNRRSFALRLPMEAVATPSARSKGAGKYREDARDNFVAWAQPKRFRCSCSTGNRRSNRAGD